jgi:hypothetical protein
MNPDLNRKLYGALSNAKDSTEISIQAHVHLPSGYRLVCVTDRAGSPFKSTLEIGLLHDSSRRIVYYQPVWITTHNAQDHCAAHSVMWRSADYQHKTALRHLALTVQFNYLLAQYDLILSDGNLRAGGPFFWEAQISAALAKGLFVYVPDEQAAQLMHIPDMASFDALKNRIWGESGELGSQVALIRREPLKAGMEYSFPLGLISHFNSLDPAKLP